MIAALRVNDVSFKKTLCEFSHYTALHRSAGGRFFVTASKATHARSY